MMWKLTEKNGFIVGTSLHVERQNMNRVGFALTGEGGWVAMADLRRVIKGLECRLSENMPYCPDCPYYFTPNCEVTINRDALELLKEHEPRVLRLSEINKYDFVWCEHNLMGKLYPAIVADCNNVTCHEFFVKNYIFEVTRFMAEDMHYGKTWRCWSSKPTDEQRKAVKWDYSD